LVRDRGAPLAKTMREIRPNGGRIGQWLHATPSMTEDAACILFFSSGFILWFPVIRRLERTFTCAWLSRQDSPCAILQECESVVARHGLVRCSPVHASLRLYLQAVKTKSRHIPISAPSTYLAPTQDLPLKTREKRVSWRRADE
jgi:hypothetical protein